MHSALPSRIAQSYGRALADAELLDQRRSIALMESLAEDLAERMKEGDTPALRFVASKLSADALQALQDGAVGDAHAKLTKLAEMLEKGAEADGSRDKLFTMADRIGARRDAAWATKLQRSQVINAMDLHAMFSLVLRRAQASLGEAAAVTLAELIGESVGDPNGGHGTGAATLAAVTIEAQTVNGGPTNGNAAS
jgi:hypothetical protein